MAMAEMKGSPTLGEERVLILRIPLRPEVIFIHFPVTSPFRHMHTLPQIAPETGATSDTFSGGEGRCTVSRIGTSRDDGGMQHGHQAAIALLTPNKSVVMMS